MVARLLSPAPAQAPTSVGVQGLPAITVAPMRLPSRSRTTRYAVSGRAAFQGGSIGVERVRAMLVEQIRSAREGNRALARRLESARARR